MLDFRNADLYNSFFGSTHFSTQVRSFSPSHGRKSFFRDITPSRWTGRGRSKIAVSRPVSPAPLQSLALSMTLVKRARTRSAPLFS